MKKVVKHLVEALKVAIEHSGNSQQWKDAQTAQLNALDDEIEHPHNPPPPTPEP